MPKNIIITCGTSLLNPKSITDKDLREKLDEIDKTNEKNQDFVNYFVKDNFENIKIKKLKNFGVELNLINKLYEKGDVIWLFFSETNGGEIVKSIFEKFFQSEKFKEKIVRDKNFDFEKQVKLITIEGYKIDDDKAFKQKAIKNFFEQLDKIEKNGNKTIMSPIGGYKAIIPYASLYAMVNGWEIKYIYEDSDEIIDLPNGMLGYMLLKAGIKDTNFKDVFNELEKGENSIFSQNVEDFKNIVKLIEATNRFVDLGDLSGFYDLKEKLPKKFKVFINYLIDLDIALKLLGIRKELIHKIMQELEKRELKQYLFYKPVLDKIKNELLGYFSKQNNQYAEKNDLEFYFSCLKFYHDKNRYAEEILFFREFLIDIVQYYLYGRIEYKKFKHPTGEYNDKGKEKTIEKNLREYIDGSINYALGKKKDKKYLYITDIPDQNYRKSEDEELKIKDLLENNGFDKEELLTLQNLRNDIAHLGNLDIDDRFKNKIEGYEKNLPYHKKIDLIRNYYFHKLEVLKNYVLNM